MDSNGENKKFITLSEVKNILRKIEKERNEITYEQRIALEHANKFSKLTSQQIKDLVKDLMKFEFIDESHVYKIVDLLPITNEDIKTIDGVKIDFLENWVHLRKSNTEPIIRIYTESNTQEAADNLALRIIDEIKEIAGI